MSAADAKSKAARREQTLRLISGALKERHTEAMRAFGYLCQTIQKYGSDDGEECPDVIALVAALSKMETDIEDLEEFSSRDADGVGKEAVQ